MKNYLILLLLAAAMLFSSCKKTPAPQPLAPVPDERQMNWHRMEFYAFVHFNMNTFTGMEWGTGARIRRFSTPLPWIAASGRRYAAMPG